MKRMTKKYLKKRIKEAENALRKIEIASNYETSDTATVAKKEIRKYVFNYSNFTIVENSKLKVTFQNIK